MKRKPSHGRKDNIEMDLREINKVVDLNQILQDRTQ
jgi:hypothetical protein